MHLAQQKRKVFTIDYTQEATYGGMEVGALEGAKWGGAYYSPVGGLLSNVTGARGRSYMTAREHLLRSGNRQPS